MIYPRHIISNFLYSWRWFHPYRRRLLLLSAWPDRLLVSRTGVPIPFTDVYDSRRVVTGDEEKTNLTNSAKWHGNFVSGQIWRVQMGVCIHAEVRRGEIQPHNWTLDHRISLVGINKNPVPTPNAMLQFPCTIFTDGASSNTLCFHKGATLATF